MWRAKSAVKLVHHHHRSQRFSCSSFKDIHQLCSPPSDDDGDLSPFQSQSYSHEKQQQQVISRLILCRSLTLSVSSDSAHSLIRSDSAPPSLFLKPPAPAAPPGIAIYYTSLHAVRPTFEACRTVQSILRGFCLKIDERDLSMDRGFLAELRELLEQGKARHAMTLPQVFIGGRCVGGAEEIRQLHEIGELRQRQRHGQGNAMLAVGIGLGCAQNAMEAVSCMTMKRRAASRAARPATRTA